jgi:uncharacterized protein (UPF0261 family)
MHSMKRKLCRVVPQNKASILRYICKISKSDYYLRFVCPSVGTEQLGSHRMDFHEIWYLSIFQNTIEKIQVLLKSDKNNEYFTWGPIYIFDHISLSSS